MNPKLTIMICSTDTRVGTFLPKMFQQINAQTHGRNDVEVLCIVDNKAMTVGRKRNQLLEMARGEYVVFVDDDDILEDNYVHELVAATKSGADVICFKLVRYSNNMLDKEVFYSKDFKQDENTPTHYKRVPNHIMCFRRGLALQVKYDDISFGEDSAWAKRILPLINTEHQINKVLYRYMYNQATSETAPLARATRK